MNQTILLISPQTEHISVVCKTLMYAGLDVFQTESIDDAKAGLILRSPAFLLLNLDTKDTAKFLAGLSDGFLQPRPYIMASGAFQQSADRTMTLRLGADVCIGTPIDAEEVMAVIYTVWRRERWIMRQSHSRRLPYIEYMDLMIDPFQRCVTMHGKPVVLTVKEFDILYLLAEHRGNVLTKDEIYRTIWDDISDINATIITDHISSIRKKLGLSSKSNHYIQTVFGVGYRFGRLDVE